MELYTWLDSRLNVEWRLPQRLLLILGWTRRMGALRPLFGYKEQWTLWWLPFLWCTKGAPP